MPDSSAAKTIYNYDKHGKGYSGFRRTDPKIAKIIHAALGPAKTVLNIGAGTGSYEPEDRIVTAVEPSETMRAQRPAHLTTAVDASAESLPFDDNSFDASMAILTIHHWPNQEKGLLEMRRVTTGPVVIVTFDNYVKSEFWLYDYAPEIIEWDRKRFPTIEFITDTLGGNSTVTPVPVTIDCQDGIQESFYSRPEAFLNPEVRKSQSTWSFMPKEIEEKFIKELSRDLESGEWDRKYSEFRTKPFLNSTLRIITANRNDNTSL